MDKKYLKKFPFDELIETDKKKEIIRNLFHNGYIVNLHISQKVTIVEFFICKSKIYTPGFNVGIAPKKTTFKRRNPKIKFP